ncbi:hypothetical protein D1872_327160 [compost metagenome]
MSLVPFATETLCSNAHPIVMGRSHDNEMIYGKADGQLIVAVLAIDLYVVL